MFIPEELITAAAEAEWRYRNPDLPDAVLAEMLEAGAYKATARRMLEAAILKLPECIEARTAIYYSMHGSNSTAENVASSLSRMKERRND